MNDGEIATCVHYVYEWASNKKGKRGRGMVRSLMLNMWPQSTIHCFCYAHSEKERRQSNGTKDNQMVEKQWGPGLCIQREAAI